jgi:hypothetical protein
MKKNATSKQKLKLSRETLRHLERHRLGEVVGGTTDFSCPITNCYPCASAQADSFCGEPI